MAMRSRIPSSLGTTSFRSSSRVGSSESLTSETGSSVDVPTGGAKHRSSIPKAAIGPKESAVDDFHLDEKVWVNGSRPGIIRFIGDTKFAPGKWIGVQLTSPEGKNDGSVAGVRYFACPNNCGVFVKPQRLTKAPMPEALFQKRLTSPAREGSSLGAATPSETSSDAGAPLPSEAASASGSLLWKNSPFLQHATNGKNRHFTIGDRVVVNASSGTKLGTLRFLGETDFAPGQWAGIELDEPLGRNDGSVAGKRYFEVKMKHGLFAPMHKIAAAPLCALSKTSGMSSARKPTSGLLKTASGSCGSRLSRAGSQDSISSVASATSIASSTATGRLSRTGIRLGVTSLKSPPGGGTAGPTATKSITAAAVAGTNAAILDALKEKDEHIAQLLKERDLERGEFSRVALQADELEERITTLQMENSRIATEADEEMAELKRLNAEYEEVQLKLSAQLEDERRRLEDIQFRLEEETLAKSELESTIETLKKEVDEIKRASTANTQETVTMVDDSVALELRRQHKQLEEKVEEKENEIFALQEEVTRKEEAIFQLEASAERRKTELESLRARLAEVEQELSQTQQRSKRLMETIDDLNRRVVSTENECRSIRQERDNLIQEIKDYETRVFAMEARLIEEVKQCKDSNESLSAQRITVLQTELEAKAHLERQLEEKLAEASSRYEKLEAQINSLTDQLRDMRRTHEEECRRRKVAEEMVQQMTANNQSLQSKVDELIHKSGSSSDMLTRLNDELLQRQQQFAKKESELRAEIESLHRDNANKENEIRNLRMEIESQRSVIARFEVREADVEKLIQANKNELQLTRSDNEQKQREIEDLRQQLKQIRDELSRANQDHSALKGELENQLARTTKELAETKQRLVSLQDELARLKSTATEAEMQRDHFRAEAERLQRLCQERDAQTERLRQQVAEQEREFRQFQAQMEQQLKAAEGDSGAKAQSLRQELETAQTLAAELENRNRLLRDENGSLAAKVQELLQDIEGMKRRHQEVVQEFEMRLKHWQQRAEDAEHQTQRHAEQLTELESRQDEVIGAFRRSAEQEKRAMEQKLDQLEARIREQQALVERQLPAAASEDVDSLEQQIEFLNSVIVDMQKKNDELRNRVQVLEEIGLGEFEHSFQSSVETTAGNGRRKNNSLLSNGHIRSIRKYCDICEMFDRHETEDCPQQSSSAPTTVMANGIPEPGHTYHAAERGHQRPFCLNCECFGHESQECPQQETF